MVSETRGCAFCGAENPSDAKFCQGCGRALHAAESASGPASGQVVIRVPQELTAVELWLAAIGWYMVIQAVLLVGGALVCLLGGGLTLVAQKQVQELLPGGGFGAGLMERPGGFLIFAGLFFSVQPPGEHRGDGAVTAAGVGGPADRRAGSGMGCLGASGHGGVLFHGDPLVLRVECVLRRGHLVLPEAAGGEESAGGGIESKQERR